MENCGKYTLKTNRIFTTFARTFVREILLVYIIKQVHLCIPDIYILFNEKCVKHKFENFKEKRLNLYKISLPKINKGFEVYFLSHCLTR